MPARSTKRTPRTLLGQRIADMRMSIEEFAEYAERYARDHKERGTVSVRHLQRLASGQRGDGQPLGTPNPATARLLEHIFGDSITRLLAPLDAPSAADDPAEEFRQTLRTARRVNNDIIALLHEQLDQIRQIDRQLGALVAREELHAKISQVSNLLTHSLVPEIRKLLAAALSEMETLAGWQALDLCDFTASWQHYERAKLAATESENPAHAAYAKAEQAFVLLDANQIKDAVAVLESARTQADDTTPAGLRSWLAAAHGEALAASGELSASLRAFDHAAQLLPNSTTLTEQPYIALDAVHLARWRGHALAHLGDTEAIKVLSGALRQLDPSFTRAETGLRIDLAAAYAANGNHEMARLHADRAAILAREVGSARQRRRIRLLPYVGARSTSP